jgi:hypothetical protein
MFSMNFPILLVQLSSFTVDLIDAQSSIQSKIQKKVDLSYPKIKLICTQSKKIKIINYLIHHRINFPGKCNALTDLTCPLPPANHPVKNTNGSILNGLISQSSTAPPVTRISNALKPVQAAAAATVKLEEVRKKPDTSQPPLTKVSSTSASSTTNIATNAFYSKMLSKAKNEPMSNNEMVEDIARVGPASSKYSIFSNSNGANRGNGLKRSRDDSYENLNKAAAESYNLGSKYWTNSPSIITTAKRACAQRGQQRTANYYELNFENQENVESPASSVTKWNRIDSSGSKACGKGFVFNALFG